VSRPTDRTPCEFCGHVGEGDTCDVCAIHISASNGEYDSELLGAEFRGEIVAERVEEVQQRRRVPPACGGSQ
jgi:hypothetical protein